MPHRLNRILLINRRMQNHTRILAVTAVLCATTSLLRIPGVQAQVTPGRNAVDLTVERMVELGLRDSYRVRQLVFGIERERSLLRAQQAGLKSRVELEISAPEFSSISDYKWNSDLQRDELVHENTRRWQADLSIRQPVILFGFPTNGYLSLNNRMYRYTQYSDERDIRFYNRYFVGYNQPLFQPNRMKNNLEGAELDLEKSELDYQNNVVNMIDDLSDDYYDLLENAYERFIAAEFLAHLETAADAARQIASADVSRAIEVDQLRVEIANAQSELEQAGSNFRLQSDNIKQRLRLAPNDSVVLDPVLDVRPIDVDTDRAIERAMSSTPRLRRLAISLRENEIRLDETRGNNAFRMNIGLTYGREMQDPRFDNLWTEPRNSYTVDVSATIPIWDWGQRKYRIQADQYNVQRTRLSAEEAQTDIETTVRSLVQNLQEYQARALSMQENMALAHQITSSTLDRYRRGEVTLVDLLQTIDREANTANNFLDAFLGYRGSLQRLQQSTYYDFEHDMPLLERFTIGQ